MIPAGFLAFSVVYGLRHKISQRSVFITEIAVEYL
jgi:hypothetical protein